MDTFTIGELATAAEVSVPAMRRMLNDAGATPRLDEYRHDPKEWVSREEVINLMDFMAGDRVGRALARLVASRTWAENPGRTTT